MKMRDTYRDDLILVTTLAGTIGSIVRAIIPIVFYYLNLYKEPAFVGVAKFMFKSKEITMDLAHFGHLFLGFIAFIALGAFLVFGLTFLYIKYGTDFYLLKGALFGVGVWVIVRTYLMGLITPEGTDHLWTHYISLFSHVVYGMLSGYIIVKLERFMERYRVR